MRHILILLFSMLLFTACDKASFDTTGNSSKGDANGFEVVTEEEADALGDQDTPDGGDQTCEGEDCSNDGDDGTGGDDGGDDTCEGDDCSDDSGDDDDNDDDDDDDDVCTENCVVTPDEVFDDENIREPHSCGEDLQEHKVNICKWPSGDAQKAHTICVARASLRGQVHNRRQDFYFVGTCEGTEGTAQRHDKDGEAPEGF